MEAALFSEAGMLVLIFYRSPGVGVKARDGVQFFYLDFSCVRKTQSQGITVDEQLHRIAERSELGQCQGLSGNDSHVKEMLSRVIAVAINPANIIIYALSVNHNK